MKNMVIHITSPDQKGIVSTYTQMLSSMRINILNLEQHVEPDDSLFFMRILAEADDDFKFLSLEEELDIIDKRFKASSIIYDTDKRLNSKELYK